MNLNNIPDIFPAGISEERKRQAMVAISHIIHGNDLPNKIDLPKYKCHKEVWALKIMAVVLAPDLDEESEPFRLSIIVPEDENYAPFKVSIDYFIKHKPKEGGYYVRYEDGYESFSPAGVFEKGYTLMVQEGFKERLINETVDLTGKCAKLSEFLTSEKFNELDRENQTLLNIQYTCMNAYQNVLCQRLAVLGLEEEYNNRLGI